MDLVNFYNTFLRNFRENVKIYKYKTQWNSSFHVSTRLDLMTSKMEIEFLLY